jgi:hypothetical protein
VCVCVYQVFRASTCATVLVAPTERQLTSAQRPVSGDMTHGQVLPNIPIDSSVKMARARALYSVLWSIMGCRVEI